MEEKHGDKAMVGNAENSGGRRGSRWRIGAWAVGALILLLIPLIGMQVSEGWDWGFFDFVFAFVVIFGAGLTFELISQKADTLAYKAAVGVAVVAGLLLVWISTAVGIIGDDEAINLLYLGVLVVGLIGAFIGRFEPQGMARASFAMAIAQLLVPVIALMIPNFRGLLMEPPGVFGVIALNLIFAMLFAGAGLLFRKAADEQSPAGARTAG
jgi:hypothetical protein